MCVIHETGSACTHQTDNTVTIAIHNMYAYEQLKCLIRQYGSGSGTTYHCTLTVCIGSINEHRGFEPRPEDELEVRS